MILTWTVYAVAASLLLGLAALTLEGVVRQGGRPIRWLWLAAMVASVSLPPLALVVPGAPPAPSSAAPVAAAEPAFPTLSPAEWLPEQPPVVLPTEAGWEVEKLLAGAWALASLALLGSVLTAHLRLRRPRRAWARRTIGGREVWVSADTGPAVIGLVRSFIVVPGWVLEREPREVEMVLAHEGEHLRARDPHLLLAALLLLVACPWNPVLWWQWRRLRQAVEVDCDLRVLSRGLDRRGYSRLLVEVAERGSARRLVLASLAESRSLLERRIELMVAERPRRWGARAALSGVVAAALVTAACRMERPISPTPLPAGLTPFATAVGGAPFARPAVAAPRPAPIDPFAVPSERTGPFPLDPGTGAASPFSEPAVAAPPEPFAAPGAAPAPAQQQPATFLITSTVPGSEVSIQAGGPGATGSGGVSMSAPGMRIEGGVVRARTPVNVTISSEAPLMLSVTGGGEPLELSTVLDGQELRRRAGAFFISRQSAGGPLITLIGESTNVLPIPRLKLPDAAADSFGVVMGSVMTTNGRPLARVPVAVAGTTRGDVTDLNGQFTITGVPAGTRRVRATARGYAEAARIVTVPPGDSVLVSIRLTTGLRDGLISTVPPERVAPPAFDSIAPRP